MGIIVPTGCFDCLFDYIDPSVSASFCCIQQECPKSPSAASTKDPHLGFNAVFPPVPSCLSKVVLVIYVQFLDILTRLDEFKNMYGPFFASIEFYVDGTWCDPRTSPHRGSASSGYPCYGDNLDRSELMRTVVGLENTPGVYGHAFYFCCWFGFVS